MENSNATRLEENDCWNAKRLDIFANINIILTIISTIAIWINFGTREELVRYSLGSYHENVLNWWGIFAGVLVLVFGFTWFYLLKTVVDIYNKESK